MPRPQHNTTSLPRDLRTELGIRDTYGEKKRKLNGPANRKERRQAERNNKKSGRPAAAPVKKTFQRRPQQKKEEPVEEDDFDLDEESSSDETPVAPDNKRSSSQKLQSDSKSAVTLKPKRALEMSDENEDDSSDYEGQSEEDESDQDNGDKSIPQGAHISETVKSKLAQDDAEIAALEKKLGLKKGKKLPKAFAEDGLDDLMGDLGEASEDDSKKRKREADEWLQSKRQKALQRQAQVSEEEEDEDFDSEDDMDNLDEEVFGSDGEDEDAEDSEFDGFDKEEEAPPKKRENPYVAPVPKSETAPTQKYIPPSLRARGDPESEALTRLRRQAQGHLNKLSEANLVSILAEFEKLYRDHPRQNVTSTLITLLMGLIGERSVLNDTFIVLHAGFIAAVYKIMGMDFGAEIVQKIVEAMDAGGDERGKFEGKEYINLVSLLCQLYNFHVIGHPLMFDYIRLFLQEINETNTELLLKIIRNAGPQLRQDDPSALKDIVLLIQPAIAKAGEGNLSVRTKFMIETITDLKNNRVRSGIGASVTSEHITKMRKILGSLNNSRVIRASEPINITRSDIHDSSKKGKWWLVGASWREDPLVSARQELSDMQAKDADAMEDDSEAEPDLAHLARVHRMNTDVRRSIFVAIMSATDFQDAHVRLIKLRLKRAQEFEIPRVLLHCAMEEDAHNPYYTLIARRLCGESGRRLKMSFMFALWNIFKRMGEQGDDEGETEFDADDEETGVSMKAVVNLAKMYGMLIADGTLSLSVLKNLNFAYLQPKTKTFVELLIISIIQQSQKTKKKKKSKSTSDDAKDEESLMQIFLRVQDAPQAAKGLIYFIRKVVAKTDLVTEKEQKLVRWGCNVAVDALKAVKD
ncbi:nuclear protein [Penicillium brasilianum]|uniref:Nuclear protein n=1 Tax=Penicillium brasilianum TaxID=104259 RepID=A0A1S9RI36_PENBI|nr:nuclear protein [Penicillium brasilianum]